MALKMILSISDDSWQEIIPTEINSLSHGRGGYNFEIMISELILRIDILRNSFDIVLWRMPKHQIHGKSTLFQVMAWCYQATSHFLSQYLPTFLSPHGVKSHNVLTKQHCDYDLAWWLNLHKIMCIDCKYSSMPKLERRLSEAWGKFTPHDNVWVKKYSWHSLRIMRVIWAYLGMLRWNHLAPPFGTTMIRFTWIFVWTI